MRKLAPPMRALDTFVNLKKFVHVTKFVNLQFGRFRKLLTGSWSVWIITTKMAPKPYGFVLGVCYIFGCDFADVLCEYYAVDKWSIAMHYVDAIE